MNKFYLHLKPSSLGTEEWAVGEKLKKVWRKHQFMQDFVVFKYMGQGTNMQWVYAVQTDEDRAVHPAVHAKLLQRFDYVQLQLTWK